MLLLGLNAFGHDAAAVFVADGEVVFAASEERFDRVRFSAAFPARAIAAGLAHLGATARDVDGVAFPWTRGMGRARKALHVLKGLPGTLAFLREPPDALVGSRRGYLRAIASLEARVAALGIHAPVRRVRHHAAHAASAALLLPDATGAVVTADGMGEWDTAALWRVARGVPSLLARAAYPHSAGKAYAAVTSWLGFRPDADEGKTMGLAAYGDPDAPAARFTRSLLRPDPRRVLRVDLRRLGYPRGEARLYGDAFVGTLGPPRAPDAPIEPVHAHAARGIQDAVEEVLLAAARDVLARSGARALGLAGGVFLNCAANGALARALDADVRPFPVAGDAGAALGAAALLHRERTGAPVRAPTSLRLGTAIDAHDAARVLARETDLALDDVALARAVAERVLDGRLVGVARGRSEAGPRALGGRSVLARADDPRVRDLLNARKGREAWRPVAPVLRETDLAALFADPRPSPFMITTLRAREDAARPGGPLAGAVHVDGTCRVLSVTPSSEPFLHAVLDATAARDVPALLDTSLNRRGEPIVETAEEALAAAVAMGLDAVVIGARLRDLRPAPTRP